MFTVRAGAPPDRKASVYANVRLVSTCGGRRSGRETEQLLIPEKTGSYRGRVSQTSC